MNMRKVFDFSNRVIVITGAAGLLGSEYADGFCQAGGNVVLADKNFDVIHKIYSVNLGVELKSFYRLLNVRRIPILHSLLLKLFLPLGFILNLMSMSSTVTVIGKKIINGKNEIN